MIHAGGETYWLHRIYQHTGLTPDKFRELTPETRAFMLASERVALEEDTARRKEWLTVSALSMQAVRGKRR